MLEIDRHIRDTETSDRVLDIDKHIRDTETECWRLIDTSEIQRQSVGD